MAIFNKYKDILNDFINSSNFKSLDYPKLIDEGLYNIFKSENNLMGLLK